MAGTSPLLSGLGETGVCFPVLAAYEPEIRIGSIVLDENLKLKPDTCGTSPALTKDKKAHSVIDFSRRVLPAAYSCPVRQLFRSMGKTIKV